MKNLRIKRVWRVDHVQNIFRLCRIMWETGEGPGSGRGHSNKLTFALQLRLFWWERLTPFQWEIVILFLRIHRVRSYGGKFA